MLVSGDGGNNNLIGTTGDDTVYGYAGDDTVNGLAGNDLLFGDEGSDSIATGDGNNTVVGGLDSTDGADLIVTGSGNDLIFGNGGNDSAAAGAGNDTMVGGYGDDVLLGNQGNDLLLGNQGSDTLYGGVGDDTLYGGMGNDLLIGGDGNDVLIGGEGDDTAVFSGPRANYNITQDQQGNFVIQNASGTTTVSSTEHFRFADQTIDGEFLLANPSTGGGGGGGQPPPPPPPNAPVANADELPDFRPAENNIGGADYGNLLDNDTTATGTLSVDSVTDIAVSVNGTPTEITNASGPLPGNVAAEFSYGSGEDTHTIVIGKDGSVNGDFDPYNGNQEEVTFNYTNTNGSTPSNPAGADVFAAFGLAEAQPLKVS